MFIIGLAMLFACIFLPTNLGASVEAPVDDKKLEKIKHDFRDDFNTSLKWAWQGSYKQFQGTQNKIFATMAILATAYFIKNDDEFSNKVPHKHENDKVFHVISDASIFFNTPVVPMAFYLWGTGTQDAHMIRFSQEYLAALGLTLLETAAISMVPLHQRPDEKNISFWEKAFRGQSSFPSGHVVGYSVLGFKSLQFYGPLIAITPLLLASATAYERVNADKHYVSDVVASGFLSLLASEGVRYASSYDKNHAVYEWIFKHNFGINYIRFDGAPGIRLSMQY